jgi:hypothetical protein
MMIMMVLLLVVVVVVMGTDALDKKNILLSLMPVGSSYVPTAASSRMTKYYRPGETQGTRMANSCVT